MIRTITIGRWKDVLKLDVEWPMDLYRGQASAEWPLQTALHRALTRSNMLEGAANTEYWMLRDFRRGAGRYLSQRPDDGDYVGWLSLMQHHGAPTRLLDFTHSFYVACYFALIDATADSAVWAIDPDFLLRVLEKAFNVECQGLRDEWEDLSTSEANQYLAELLATASSSEPEEVVKGAVQVHPFTLHTRLSAQQGLFLMPLDVELDFLENLRPFRTRGRFPIKKIVLKREMRDDALAHLREMNITAETLFPGIDGFARSILQRQRVF
jgi:hypothetical protein